MCLLFNRVSSGVSMYPCPPKYPDPCHPKNPEPCLSTCSDPCHPKYPDPCPPKYPDPCHPKSPEPCPSTSEKGLPTQQQATRWRYRAESGVWMPPLHEFKFSLRHLVDAGL
uniref:Uncharacterized protein n=1 Tax=Sarcophilus harrisii TaxID=9305 RepID=A0A7N4V4Z2_SARHA